MSKRQRVVHRDDQLPHVPDREEAVGGGKVHEVEAAPGRPPAPSRSCRPSRRLPRDLTQPGWAPRAPRRSLARNDRESTTSVRRRPIDEDGELVLGRLPRKCLEQLPAEPAKPPPIGKAASVDSDSHGQFLKWSYA